jgi:pimeloyl-ACP methyl ester carboxylesterase
VIFHYRGCWGSEGTYNFDTLADDVIACLDYLDTGANPQVDTGKVVLVGHSMGGWAAVMAAANDPRPKAIALIGPVVAPGLLPFDEDADDYVPWLPRLSANAFRERWLALASDSKWSAASHVSRVAPRPIIDFHARDDDAVPLQQSQMLSEKAGLPFDLVIHDEANHAFTWHRPWLREQLFGWLDRLAL